MKTKTPEKIYLYPYSTDGIYEVEIKPLEGTVEYTRTDAFIKKACEGIEHLLSGYIIRNFHFGGSYEMDTLIEDIKNYMKGE